MMQQAPIHIVKIGGNVLSDPMKRKMFLRGFASLHGTKILVHGGGKIASDIAGKLGVEVKMLEGRRITDAPMLDVVTMTYAGLINKQLVASLQALGVNAFGLTGADGNMMTSRKRPAGNGIDYGWTGDPVAVNVAGLKMLWQNGYLPVMASLTHDVNGNILNTNADTIASHLASALAPHYEVTLLYCFEQQGVLADTSDGSSVIKFLDLETYLGCKQKGIISGGMIPKIDNAFHALKRGVHKICIMNYESLGCFEKGINDGYTVIK